MFITITEKQIGIALGLLLAVLFVLALDTGVAKAIEHECYTWQDQAEDYPLFNLETEHRSRCASLGIAIN